MTNLEKVRQFMETFGQECPSVPGLVNKEVEALRYELIREELQELKEAMDNNDLVEIADACGDLLYVIYGCALTYGLPIDKVVEEIHGSNMSKLDENGKPIYRADGKILKSDKYYRPNISKVLYGE